MTDQQRIRAEIAEAELKATEALLAEERSAHLTKVRAMALDYAQQVRACDALKIALSGASFEHSAEQVEVEAIEARHVVTTGDPFGLRCLRCGATKGLTLPISVDELCVASEAFTGVHRECREIGA